MLWEEKENQEEAKCLSAACQAQPPWSHNFHQGASQHIPSSASAEGIRVCLDCLGGEMLSGKHALQAGKEDCPQLLRTGTLGQKVIC